MWGVDVCVCVYVYVWGDVYIVSVWVEEKEDEKKKGQKKNWPHWL